MIEIVFLDDSKHPRFSVVFPSFQHHSYLWLVWHGFLKHWSYLKLIKINVQVRLRNIWSSLLYIRSILSMCKRKTIRAISKLETLVFYRKESTKSPRMFTSEKVIESCNIKNEWTCVTQLTEFRYVIIL